jgi:Zn-dependent protease with chaperone function
VLKPRRLLAFVFGLLWFSAPHFPAALQAQSSAPASSPTLHNDFSDSVDGDEAPPPYFLTIISFDGSGTLKVNANAFQIDRDAARASDLKAALSEALGCSLTDDTRLPPTPTLYTGSCTLSSSISSFLRQGEITTASLRRYCEHHGIETIALGLHFPDSDIFEVTPPAPDFSTKSPGKRNERLLKYVRRQFSYTWPLRKPIPTAVEYRFGYDSSTLARKSILLFLALLAPLGLSLWLGRKALSAQTNDKAVVWFSYMRCLQWILNGSLIGWWLAIDYVQLASVLDFVSAGSHFAGLGTHPVSTAIIAWVPPAVIWLLCYRLSHPVQQQLRGLPWTKKELTLQAFYSLLVGLFPFAMFLTGLGVMGTGDIRGGLYWFTAAFTVRVLAAKALLRLTGMQPHALTSGDLRDRAFALADHLGVKLQQVYLIPSGKGQMANAFARTGDTISFTDFLLQRMSQREVDYVLAHELTHLRLKHPAKLGYLYLGGYLLGFATISFTAPFLHGFTLASYAIFFCFVTAFPSFFIRRFEYSADAGAVAATGDPRAAISALFKLSELNMMPTQWSRWSEKWLTHPSGLRRANAIAKKVGIPFEEISAIAREGAANAPTYSPQSIIAPSDKLHSTQYKKASVQKISYILLAILSFVPCFFALAAQHFSQNRILTLSPFALAIPSTFAMVLLLSNYNPRLTRGDLAGRLDQKLSAQGIQVASWSGIYVGFSPAVAPRVYEANSYWDIGYLFFRSDRICYWGEEMQFMLRRDQITEIKLDIAAPGFLGAKRVYIAWRDNEQGTCGVFNLGQGHADSIRDSSRRTKELADRLQIWWKTQSSDRPLPPPLDTLSSPVPRNITCTIPGARWTREKLVNELFATAWIAAAAAVLCGLPFHLIAYLTASSYARVGTPNLYHSPGVGWLVVLAAPLVKFLSLIPTLLYRDRPILIAQTPSKTRTTAAPPPDPSHCAASSDDAVLTSPGPLPTRRSGS